MNKKSLSEIVAMAREARDALSAYEGNRGGVVPFTAVQQVGSACLETRDKLIPELAERLGPRRMPAFREAVFRLALAQSYNGPREGNPLMFQSLKLIEDRTSELLEEMDAEAARPAEPSPGGPVNGYVAASHIAELRELVNPRLDVSRLVRFLEELNLVSAAGCHMATACLVRAITDHVPPVFRVTNFAQVANNYGGGAQSFKSLMRKLDGTLRDVADGHLHGQMRRRESLPTAHQVDMRQELDSLVGEVVRVLRDTTPEPTAP